MDPIDLEMCFALKDRGEDEAHHPNYNKADKYPARDPKDL